MNKGLAYAYMLKFSIFSMVSSGLGNDPIFRLLWQLISSLLYAYIMLKKINKSKSVYAYKKKTCNVTFVIETKCVINN